MEIQVPGLSQCVLCDTVYDDSMDNSAAIFTVRHADYKHLGSFLSYIRRKYITVGCFGGLGVAFWLLVPKFTGSNSAQAVRILG